MKIRESGMPERRMWEKFFDPPAILLKLGLDAQVRDAVEVGCGYGTFTIPAAEEAWLLPKTCGKVCAKKSRM